MKAFTLIEILVVVVVIAICGAMIAIHASDTGDIQVTSAAKKLSRDLQYARSLAISSQSAVTIQFDLAQESYTMLDSDGVPLVDPVTKENYVVKFPEMDGMGRVDIATASFGGGSSVTFDDLGSPDNGGAVTLSVGEHQYTVNVVAATGRVVVNQTVIP